MPFIFSPSSVALAIIVSWVHGSAAAALVGSVVAVASVGSLPELQAESSSALDSNTDCRITFFINGSFKIGGL
jgi:hypothetical protein